MTTMTTINAILKEVYAPRIEDQLNQEVNVLKRIERTTENLVETPGGKYSLVAIKVQRNNGIGSRLENEALPAAGTQGYATIQVPLYRDYGTVRVTGDVLKMARTNPQAFANVFDREMDGLKDDLVKNTNRVVQSDGTGLLATCNGTDGANTFNVVNGQYLEVGQIVDILVRSSGAALATSRTITALARVGATTEFTVTYSGADVTVTNTHGVYRAGNFTSGVQREPTGLGRIIDNTSVLHNLNPSTQPRWAANIDANGGTNRALSEGLMIKMCDDIRIACGAKPTVIFTSLGVRRAYFNLLTQQRRYTDVKSFSGGMQGLPFNYDNEIPVITDVDAPPNRMRFVTESELVMLMNTNWEWIDEDGAILARVQGFDSFEGNMRKFWELGTRQRNSHGEIRDITEG